MNKNTKSYSVRLRNSKAFSFILVGFQFATSLFFRIRFKIPITFVPKLIGKLVTVINLKRVRLVISQMKLITKITQTISLKRVRLTFNLKQIMQFVTTVFIRNPISFAMSTRQKLISTMKTGILRVIVDPTLAVFFTLGDFDPDTLLTLDSLTLGDMDYTS